MARPEVFLFILLLLACLAGNIQAQENSNNYENSQNQAPIEAPPLNLRDLLPQSEDPVEEGPIYSITDQPAARPASTPPATRPPAQPPPLKPENEPAATPASDPEAKLESEIKPETKPEPPQFKPDDPLNIPPEAVRNNDLSFLQGCWVADTNACNNSSYPITLEYCFDEKGGGLHRVYTRFGRGKTFSGTLRAHFDNSGRLYMTTPQTNTVGSDWPTLFCRKQIMCTVRGEEIDCIIYGTDSQCCSFRANITLHRK